MRPRKSVVEDIDGSILCLLGGHDLEIDRVLREVASLNRLIEVFDVVIWLFACKAHGHI